MRDHLHPTRLAGEPYWAFARAMLRYRTLVATCFVMTGMSALSLGVGLAGAKPVLDAILGKGQGLRAIAEQYPGVATRLPEGLLAALPTDPFDSLAWILSSLCVLAAIGASATFAHQHLSLTVVNRTIASVRQRAFRSLLRAPLREGAIGGDGVSRIVNDAGVLANGMQVLLGKAVLQGAKGVAAFVAAFGLEWRVSAVALLATAPLYTIIRKLGKRIRRASGAAMEGQGQLLDAAGQTLRALRVVKAYDAEVFEAGRFHRINKRVLKESNRLRTARAIASPLTEFLTIVLLCAMTLVAARAIIASKVDPSRFILAIAALATAGAALKPLTALVQDIQQSSPAAARLRELIALPPEPGHEPGLPDLPRHAKAIEFREVSLTYPGRDAPALGGVTLSVRHGERVAFVGPNGCGKTTLLSLVPRLFDPDAGRVLIDGADVRSVRVRSLRAQVGVVTQETVLFRGTIRENIAYGTWGEEDAIVDAARRARAHDFIASLPLGYGTPVGEAGSSLSGGQRQRIAIARAILKDPSILILDEATSMIDAESEAQIGMALAQFSSGRTTLIVAHRLSTVIHCDRIVVMDAGRVVDVGTHAQLLERCALYQQLARHQLG
jgi:ABC-type multidrug transport system fused ATPase/permease subunit